MHFLNRNFLNLLFLVTPTRLIALALSDLLKLAADMTVGAVVLRIGLDELEGALAARGGGRAGHEVFFQIN